MKKVIGYLKVLSTKLFAKDIDDNLRELHSGSSVYSDEIVVDASGQFVPDALQDIKSIDVDESDEENNVESNLHSHNTSHIHPISKNPLSTTSIDVIDPETDTEVNINAHLHSYDFLDEGSGIERHPNKYEVDINARLWEYKFGEYNSPFPVSGSRGNQFDDMSPVPPITVIPPTPIEPSIPVEPPVVPIPPNPPLVISHDDSATVMEGSNSIKGNLLINDMVGNGGSIVFFTYTKEDGSIATGRVGSSVDTIYGRLTIEANGNYSYISDLEENHPLNGSLFDNITYTIVDNNGTSSSSQFKVEVTDDTPIARADTNSVKEDGADQVGLDDGDKDTTIIGGNLFGSLNASSGDVADRLGADNNNLSTAVTPQVTVGKYGELTLLSNGEYIYVLDNTNPAVQNITTGEILTEQFNYTITDSDGDSSTTTLTITIDGRDDGISLIIPDNDTNLHGDEVVYESGLPNGSHIAGESSSILSSFEFVALDGIGGSQGKLQLNGDGVVVEFSESQLKSASVGSPLDVNTGEGTLHIIGYSWNNSTGLGIVNYSYDLKDAQTHPNANGNNSIVDPITITVIDQNGSSDTDILDIRIVDDIPKIKIDVDTTIAEPILEVDESDLTVNSNVNYANNFKDSMVEGADRVATSTTTYRLSTIGGDSGLIDVETGQKVLLSINGLGVVEGHTATSNNLVFTLTATNTGDVSLDQLRALSHPNKADSDDTLSMVNDRLISITKSVEIVDNDGDISKDSATINIASDLHFKDDGPSVTQGTTLVSTAVLEVDESNLSVDATSNFSVAFKVATPNYGADKAGSTVESYRLTSTANVTTVLKDTGTNEYIKLVNNSGVIEGRSVTTNKLVFEITVDSTTGEVKLDQKRAIVHTNTNSDNEYTPLLNANDIHLIKDAVTTDKDGDIAKVADTIDIGDKFRFRDDGLTAKADSNDVKEADKLKAIGNVIDNTTDNTQDDILSADKPVLVVAKSIAKGDTKNDSTGSVGVTLNGEYGEIKLNSDGSYTYDLNNADVRVQHLKDGENLTEIYTYTIKDGDGDTSHTTLTIDIQGKNDGAKITTHDSTVYEEALSTGSNPSSNKEEATNTIDISAKDGLGKVTIVDKAGVKHILTESDLVNSSTTPISIDTKYGTLEINGFTPKHSLTDSSGNLYDGSGKINYTYAITANTTDHSTAGKDSVVENISIEVEDRVGKKGSSSIKLTVVDDVPTAKADTNDVKEDDKLKAIGNVIDNTTDNTQDDILSADKPVLVVGIAKGNTVNDPIGSVGVTLNGEYGEIKLNSDGSYTYDLNNNDVRVQHLRDGENLTEIYTYTIKDGDGDTSHTTLTIDIQGKNDGAKITTHDSTVYEEALSTGSNPSSNKEEATNTIDISAKDGLGKVTIVDKAGVKHILTESDLVNSSTTPISIDTKYGTLEINGFTPKHSLTDSSGNLYDGSGKINYTYAITANTTDHSTAGKDSVVENISIEVEDRDREQRK